MTFSPALCIIGRSRTVDFFLVPSCTSALGNPSYFWFLGFIGSVVGIDLLVGGSSALSSSF
jgi:hypothetical protein